MRAIDPNRTLAKVGQGGWVVRQLGYLLTDRFNLPSCNLLGWQERDVAECDARSALRGIAPKRRLSRGQCAMG
jgi:hypothetical protein